MNYQNYKNIDVFIISVLITFLLYAVQINISFGLWDEGFLWYGVQRTMLSEVPIRDFMAYDPGRYYWCASIMTLLGSSSLIALRISIGIFQLIGVYLSLKIIKEFYQGNYRISFLFFCSIIISVWMTPQHKVFDIVSSIVIFYALYEYSKDLNKRRALYLGVIIGFVAVWGRNHGIYGFFSSILILMYYGLLSKSGIKEQFKNFSIGIILGYLPMLAMVLFVDGYFNAFIDSILSLFSQGKTNITLPVPWLWSINYTVATLKDILISVLFTAMPLYSVFGVIYLIKNIIQKKDIYSLLVCSIILNIAYMHFAFSRADLAHLSQSIFPMLLGLLYILAKMRKLILFYVLSGTVLFFSSEIMLSRHPIYNYLFGSYKKTIIGDELFYVSKKTEYDVNFIKKSIENISDIDNKLLIVPYWPGAYALLGIKSPVWESYALFDRNDDFQYRELERIKQAKPSLVIINNSSLDNNDSLKYQNTHNIVYSYIVSNYDLVEIIKDKKYFIYRTKSED
jgi:hypothetical protein